MRDPFTPAGGGRATLSCYLGFMQRLRRPLPRALGLTLFAVLTVAAVLLAALGAWGMAEAFREGPAVAVAPSAPRPVTRADVEASADEALDAVRSGDRLAYRAALPAEGAEATAALDELWEHLAPLQWGVLAANVAEIRSSDGAFDITVTGTIGGAGPRDRIVAERVLVFEREGGRVVASGDRTPAQARRQFLMAFERPRLLKRDGAVVVYDASWAPEARRLAGCVPAARARVAEALGERLDKPIVVLLYSSTNEVVDYLGNPQFERRVRFFSRVPTTVSRQLWAPSDIGVVAPALGPGIVDAQSIITHEVTHALTTRWFFETRNDPTLLEEGAAVAVADKRLYLPLRNDLADGRLTFPLLDGFARDGFWTSKDMDKVELAYLEAGATAKYILARWGVQAYKRFATDVADTSLSRQDIKATVEKDLGVTWAEFYAGWVDYVETLP